MSTFTRITDDTPASGAACGYCCRCLDCQCEDCSCCQCAGCKCPT